MNERRDEIIGAVRELVERDPMCNPSVRAVARAVAISPAAIYSHFRDLEDLLVHLRRTVAIEMFERARAAVDHRDPSVQISCAAHASMVDSILAEPGLYTWMSRSNHLGNGDVERLIARDMHERYGLPIEVGVNLITLTYLNLSQVPAMAEMPGMDRDILVEYVHANQGALADAVMRAGLNTGVVGSLSENVSRM